MNLDEISYDEEKYPGILNETLPPFLPNPPTKERDREKRGKKIFSFVLDLSTK